MNNEISPLHFRYDIMKSCWNIDCTLRPSFAVLANELSDILESDAGYVDLSYTGHQREKKTSLSGHYTPLITTDMNRDVLQRDERYKNIRGHMMKEMYEGSEGPALKEEMCEDIGDLSSETKNVVRHSDIDYGSTYESVM